MGKTSRFFKALFGYKPPDQPTNTPDINKQPKRRWSFFKTQTHHYQPDPSLTRPRHTPRHPRTHDQTTDGSTNYAVAAVAAVHAAAEVAHMTNITTLAGPRYGVGCQWAAVRIQAYYRGYLARKALRALKSLVKLQALVRGRLTRKQAAEDLRWFQALARVQARARVCQVQVTESPQSITKGPPTPEKFEHANRSRIVKRNQPSMLKNNCSRLYDDRTDRLLGMDTEKSHIRRRNLFPSDQISYSHSQSLTTSRGSTLHQLGPSPSGSYEVSSLTGPLKWFPHDFEEQVSLSTVQNSPPFYAYSSKNASTRVGPFTPAKSDSSRSCLSGYSDHPNYMAYTQSSRAKVRSVSAPRQRPNVENPSITKRYSVYGYGSGAHRGSNLRDSFVSKAYPGSGRLDQLGMPVGGIGFRESEFSGGYWN